MCGVQALFWAWALTEFGFLAQVLYACASVIGRWLGGRWVGGGQLALVVRCGDPGLRLMAAFYYAADSSAWVLHTRVRYAIWAALCGSPPRIRLLTAGGFINMRVHHVTKAGCASGSPPVSRSSSGRVVMRVRGIRSLHFV